MNSSLKIEKTNANLVKLHQRVIRADAALKVEKIKISKARHFLPEEFIIGNSECDSIFRPQGCISVCDTDTILMVQQAFSERKYNSIFQLIANVFGIDRHDVCLMHERKITRNGKKTNATYVRYVFNLDANDLLKSTGEAKFDVSIRAWNLPVASDPVVKGFLEEKIKDYFSVLIDIDSGVVWLSQGIPINKRKVESEFERLPHKLLINVPSIINLIAAARSVDEIKYETIVFHDGKSFVRVTDNSLWTECPIILARYSVANGTPRYAVYSVVPGLITQINFGKESSVVLAKYMDSCRVLNINGFDTHPQGERNTGFPDGTTRISNSQCIDRSEALEKLKANIIAWTGWDVLLPVFYSMCSSLGLFLKAESNVRLFVFRDYVAEMCVLVVVAAKNINDVKSVFDGHFKDQINSGEYKELHSNEKVSFIDAFGVRVIRSSIEIIQDYYGFEEPSQIFTEMTLDGDFSIIQNNEIDAPDLVINEFLDVMRQEFYLDNQRPEMYALLISLGFHDAARSICKLYFFEDSRQIIAALNIEEILEDKGFVEFHEFIGLRKYRELTWDEKICGHNIEGTKCVLNFMDLIPGGTLPEIVLFESSVGNALITTCDVFFEVKRLSSMLERDARVDISSKLEATLKSHEGAEGLIEARELIISYLSSGGGSLRTTEQAKYLCMKLNEILL